MIILKTLRWSNCFSYAADNVIHFDKEGLTQIIGVNGSGKSSIPLILEEILYNKNSRGTKKIDIPNRNLEDKTYSINLEFNVDDDSYVIDLVRKSSIKLKLLKNGVDISSHTTTNTFKTVESLLGIDFKTFSQLVYQSTTSSLQFLTATDTTRKRFLIELLGLDKYVKYFELFKTLVKEYNTRVISLSSTVDTFEKWILDNDLKGTKVLKLLNLEIYTDEEEGQSGILSEEIKNIKYINRKISKNNLFKEQLAEIDLTQYPGGHFSSIISYDEDTKEIGGLRAVIKASNQQIEYINALEAQCPTCKQDIEEEFKASLLREHIISAQTSEEQIHVLESAVQAIKTSNELIREKQKAERDFGTLYSAVDPALRTDLLDIDYLTSKLAALKAVIKDKRTEIERITAENLKIGRNNTRIAVIKEQTDEIGVKLSKASKELVEVQSLHGNLEMLKKAFSTNGLLAYKIEYLVKELEEIVNEYLADLSDGRFTLLFAVAKDKLNVHITDEGKEVDILSLSSGELGRVNTATLLAIRRLMNSISKSQINVLFLDEVISVLDDPGRERLVDVLVQENKLNTFIVSHEWSHPLLAKLNIVKENNISNLRNN